MSDHTLTKSPAAEEPSDGPASMPGIPHDPMPTSTHAVITAAAVLAPSLFLISSIFWVAENDTGRALTGFWGAVCFVVMFAGFARLTENRAPVGAAVVTVLGAIGSMAAAAFTLELAMVDVFGVDRLTEQTDEVAAWLMLRVPGLMFPVALVVLAAVAWRSDVIQPVHAGLLAVGGVMFPIGRISETSGIGLATDVVLTLALVPAALVLTRGRVAA